MTGASGKPFSYILSGLFCLLSGRALTAVGHLVPALVAIGIAATRGGGAATAPARLHRASRGRRGAVRGRACRGIAGRGTPATGCAAFGRERGCRGKSGLKRMQSL